MLFMSTIQLSSNAAVREALLYKALFVMVSWPKYVIWQLGRVHERPAPERWYQALTAENGTGRQ